MLGICLIVAYVVLEIATMRMLGGSFAILTIRELLSIVIGTFEEVTSDEARHKLCGALVLLVVLAGIVLLSYVVVCAFTGDFVISKVASCLVMIILLVPIAILLYNVNRRWIVRE